LEREEVRTSALNTRLSKPQRREARRGNLKTSFATVIYYKLATIRTHSLRSSRLCGEKQAVNTPSAARDQRRSQSKDLRALALNNRLSKPQRRETRRGNPKTSFTTVIYYKLATIITHSLRSSRLCGERPASSTPSDARDQRRLEREESRTSAPNNKLSKPQRREARRGYLKASIATVIHYKLATIITHSLRSSCLCGEKHAASTPSEARDQRRLEREKVRTSALNTRLTKPQRREGRGGYLKTSFTTVVHYTLATIPRSLHAK
jgi:hypothetical protein